MKQITNKEYEEWQKYKAERAKGHVLKVHPEYRKYLPELTEDTVQKVIDRLGKKVRKQAVVELVMGRYELIKK